MRNQTKVHLYLDVRKKLTNNHHPITIVVNHLGKRKFYRTRYSTTKDYFEKASTAKRGQSADDWDLWRKQEKKAKDIIDTIPYFNWERFERLFKSTGKINIKSYFEARIKKLLEQNRAGTARSYQAAINSLTEFQSEIIFSDITPDWLEKYEAWMEGKGKSITTIGIYCRNLRAIFNQAIKDGFIDKVFYPFNDFIIPNEESRKKALSLSHLTKLKEYNPLPNEDFYIGLWWFSFYGSGMNLKDILGIKWIDIKDGRMEFYRKKTRRTRKANLKKVSVPMDEYHEQFINRFGCYDKEYIFYLYNENTNSLTRHLRVDQLNKMINKKIRKAAEAVELGIDVTLYSARHAFASLLNEKNVPLSYIKEQLVHTDIKTTQRYLDSIDKTKEKVYRSYLKVS